MSGRQLTTHIVMPHIARELIPAMTAPYRDVEGKFACLGNQCQRSRLHCTDSDCRYLRSLETWIVVGVIYLIPLCRLLDFRRRRCRLLPRSESYWTEGRPILLENGPEGSIQGKLASTDRLHE
jgi:hypothetical protein